MRREDVGYVLVFLILAFLVMLAATSCAKLGVDNTASGGGNWTLETYHPCVPPESKPIGGNVRATGNDTTRGGNIGAEAKP